jgi:hypothetical protein
MNKSIFGESTTTLAPKEALKNPNMYRESIIYDTVSRLPKTKIDEFCTSKEAKIMVNEGYLSQESLERLAKEHGIPSVVKTLACHIAREENDELFQTLLMANREAHMCLEKILDKYGLDAAKMAEKYAGDMDKIIPDYFKK